MTSKSQKENGQFNPRVAVVVGDGAYEFPIVGESHYQSNIELIAGRKTEDGVRHRCIVSLIPEPTNPYDPHAVKVDIEGKVVGYLSRDVAGAFLKALSAAGFGAAVARAIVVGGWDRGRGDVGSFGVKLNVAVPFVLETPHPSADSEPKIFQAEEVSAASPSPQELLPERKKRKWPAILVLLIFVVIIFNVFGNNSKAEKVVVIFNTQFGRISEAKLEGMFSDTLRLDWTALTTKMDVIAVMAAIGNTKSNIYDSGIRYLKFPNDAGGYNIIDWKTGEKKSVSEKARFYFP